MSKSNFRHIFACVCGLALLAGCGGGEYSSTPPTLICTPGPCPSAGLEVSLPNAFKQEANNLPVVVDSGPANIFSLVASSLRNGDGLRAGRPTRRPATQQMCNY